jgi:hypothetical protein
MKKIKKLLNKFNTLPTAVKIIVFSQASLWLVELNTLLMTLPILIQIPLVTLVNVSIWYVISYREKVETIDKIR